MIDQLLARRGYIYGSGLLSPNHFQFVVNIPKNASSFILDWTERFGWRANQADHFAHRIGEVIVVLRDPVDRWVSGISQYISTYILSVQGPNGPIFPGEPISAEFDYPMSADDFVKNYNQITERLLFDVIYQFDDHVWPQVDFFKDLLPEKKRTYFYLGEHFEKKLASYLNIEHINGLKLDRNSNLNDVNKRILHNFFAERLELRPELKTRIVKAYSRDYDLINSVKFK
jgi:hypothetical protein